MSTDESPTLCLGGGVGHANLRENKSLKDFWRNGIDNYENVEISTISIPALDTIGTSVVSRKADIVDDL
jgi:hypothetical protein